MQCNFILKPYDLLVNISLFTQCLHYGMYFTVLYINKSKNILPNNCLFQSNKPLKVENLIVRNLPRSNLYHRKINGYHFYLKQKHRQIKTVQTACVQLKINTYLKNM